MLEDSLPTICRARVSPDCILMTFIHWYPSRTDAGHDVGRWFQQVLVAIITNEARGFAFTVDLACLTGAEMRGATREAIVSAARKIVSFRVREWRHQRSVRDVRCEIFPYPIPSLACLDHLGLRGGVGGLRLCRRLRWLRRLLTHDLDEEDEAEEGRHHFGDQA